MGKPKFSRKKYVTPSHPWQADRIKAENELKKKYGLKNKREIWKAETVLRRYRGQTRTLLAKISSDPQAKKESDQLLIHLTRMNILPHNSNLDDVLALENESILSRRLQTLTYLKGLANTPDHARQLICHGHIAISGRKITVPSYMVTKQEENEIGYTNDSALNDTMHPARPRADFKPIPIKKEDSGSEKPKTEVEPKTEIKEEKPGEGKPETTGEIPVAEQPVEERPEETPKAEEPKGEKPGEGKPETTVETPKAEEPKGEKPGEGKPETTVETPAAEQPVEEKSEETPKAEEPQEKKPAKEEAEKTEETSAEQPSEEKTKEPASEAIKGDETEKPTKKKIEDKDKTEGKKDKDGGN